MAKEAPKEKKTMEIGAALVMYEYYKGYWSENYSEANIDLKMASGDTATHWGSGWDNTAIMLKNEPYPVVNELPQYIHQVTNDIRQNTPSIKVIPDGDGDKETADAFSDIIRGIEYKSCADESYDTSAEYVVTCGIGFIMVDHDYCDYDSMLQELQIKTVPDPLSVWIDPASVECDGRDAMGAIALEPINKSDFERLYKGKLFSSFTEPKAEAKESIVIGNIYVKEITGGEVTDGVRTPQNVTIRRYKFSGKELLAETTFPGDYVPVVPVYGEVKWINGKRIVTSLIRQAREPQRRLNHWAKKESQLLSMAPTAPIMAVEGTLVNERGQWQTPSKEMALEYRQKDLNGDPAPPPQRLNPPQIPTGIINAMQGAKDNIKESMGIYNAGLGKREGDSSGIALQSLQREGDVATFHFPDNVRRSIAQVGRILVSAVPVIYDTPRVVQIVNEEADSSVIGINGAPLQDGQKQPYDLTTGKYHVRVTTGASYTTKRQESAKLFGDVLKADPQLMQVIGDLWAKNLDVAGAEAMAGRLKKMIPPQLLADDNQDPVVSQLQAALQKCQAEIQQLGAALQSKQGDEQLKAAELQIKNKEVEIKGIEAQAKMMQAQAGAQPNHTDGNALDAAYKSRELQIKEYEAETKRMQVLQKAPEQQGFKLDTTGFQFAKTPEAEAAEMEATQQQQLLSAQSAEQERIENEQKAAQANAIIQTLNVIAQQVQGLAQQVAQPKTVIRDENGAIQGVK